jgi:protein tyrosine phosphatase (PTP) superfamily phosphohydrolase (DUF442 family)
MPNPSRLLVVFLLFGLISIWLEPKATAQDVPKPVDAQTLHNVWRLSPRIISGSEPEDEAAFAELAKLGVKTIVSVDGIAPRIDLASKYGLRYVHVPIGYDGIDEHARLSLTRVAADISGTIYVHCHHGKHRGPAAAAIVCRADDGRSGGEARTILEKAGTGKEYPGLWRDVEQYTKPARETKLPMLYANVKVESLTDSMARLDRTFDRLKLFSQSKWQPMPKHPDLVANLEAVQLMESFTEAARVAKSDELQKGLKIAAEKSEALRRAIESGDRAAADKVMTELTADCSACHKLHRNQ